MKKNSLILMATVILLGMQACSRTSGKESAAVAVAPAPVVKVALTPAERKAKLQKEEAQWAEKRKARLAKLAKDSPTFTDSDGTIVYYQAEANPGFVGGNDAMMDYLHRNLKYPEAAREQGIEGTVFVDFIVTKFGNVRAAEVTDTTNGDVDQGFRNEALRVVAGMPKWQPGRQHGKPVAVKYSIPITFEMI